MSGADVDVDVGVDVDVAGAAFLSLPYTTTPEFYERHRACIPREAPWMCSTSGTVDVFWITFVAPSAD